LLKLMSHELMAVDSFEDVFNLLKEAPLRCFGADELLQMAYENPDILQRLQELKEEKYETLMAQVAAQPRAAPPMLPPTPPMSPRLQELLDQVEFDDDEDDEEDEESDEDEDDSSEASPLMQPAVPENPPNINTLANDFAERAISQAKGEPPKAVLTREIIKAEEIEAPSTTEQVEEQQAEVQGESSTVAGLLSEEEAHELHLKAGLFPHELQHYTQKYRALQQAFGGNLSREVMVGLLGQGMDPAASEEDVALNEEDGNEDTALRARIAATMDEDQDGGVSLYEYIRWMAKIKRGSTDERARLAFEAYDRAGRGVISRGDMAAVLRSVLPNTSAEGEEHNEALALLVDEVFKTAGVAPEQTMDFVTFSKLCQGRDVVLQKCLPEHGDVTERLRLMNDELQVAQQELLSAPRQGRGALKKRIQRLDLVCRQTRDTLNRPK